MKETEAQYSAPADTALPRLDDLPQVARASGPVEQVLQAEYFDTDDLRLMQTGITLRRRTGGSDAGWHLKLPAGNQVRTDIRPPLPGAVRKVPAELADLVRAYTRGKELGPVATLTTRRRVTTLLTPAGESLAEVADDDVYGNRHGNPTSDSHWREVGVELTGGDDRLLSAADKVLRRNGLKPAGQSAKLERVLGSQLSPPRQQAPLDTAAPAYQIVVAYLKEHAEALKALDPMVRRDEPDSVHKMRVATRRLRSTLRTFGTIVSGDGTADLAQELKWLGDLLGAARDVEVQAGRLQRHVDSTDVEQLLGPVQARVQAYFAKARATARADVLTALNSERYDALLDALDALITSPPLGDRARQPAGLILPATVDRGYRKMRRRMRRAMHAPVGQPADAALHQARKAAKQARYAAEAATPVLGGPADRFAGKMKKMQSVLGEHHDTVVSRQLERKLAISAHAAGEVAFSYGLFFARDARAGQDLAARARTTWQHAARRRYRRWTGCLDGAQGHRRNRR